MMIDFASILPDRSSRLKYNSDDFLIGKNINANISYNDYLFFQSQICDIVNNIQTQKVPIDNSVDNLKNLLEFYKENAFEDIIKYNIIPLIVFNLNVESMNCTFFIHFLLIFLKRLKQCDSLNLINMFVNQETIKFLCDFLKESINNQNYTCFSQKYALKSLLVILENHESSAIFFSDPKNELLTTLIFLFKKYLIYTNGKSGHLRFNIHQLNNQSIQALFKSSILITRCFSIFFSVTKEFNDIVASLLIEAAQSECFQVNNEAMSVLIKCSERYPTPFFNFFHKEKCEKIFITLLDPDIIDDESTHVLSLNIIANITSRMNSENIIQFLIETQIISNFSKLLKNESRFKIIVLPISLILIDIIHKSQIALKGIFNSDPQIIQNILKYFSSDLRNKDKCAILYLFASCVFSFDDAMCLKYLPFLIEIGLSNSIFTELIEVIDSTQSEKMVLCIIQCIIRMLDYATYSNKKAYAFMIDSVQQLLSIELLTDISLISSDHQLWSTKLIEMINNYRPEQ